MPSPASQAACRRPLAAALVACRRPGCGDVESRVPQRRVQQCASQAGGSKVGIRRGSAAEDRSSRFRRKFGVRRRVAAARKALLPLAGEGAEWAAGGGAECRVGHGGRVQPLALAERRAPSAESEPESNTETEEVPLDVLTTKTPEELQQRLDKNLVKWREEAVIAQTMTEKTCNAMREGFRCEARVIRAQVRGLKLSKERIKMQTAMVDSDSEKEPADVDWS